jgi:hypothetical protein
MSDCEIDAWDDDDGWNDAADDMVFIDDEPISLGDNEPLFMGDTPETKPEQIMVIIYTPNGTALEVEAKDQEHAEWLQRMNPKPKPNLYLIRAA